MPWSISKKGSEYCVIKDDDGSEVGCHATRDEAADQIRALYASEKDDDASLEDVLSAIADLTQLLTPSEASVQVEQVEQSVVETDIEVPIPEHFSWEGVLTYEGLETGDRRFFKEGAVTWDQELLPFPFKWQRVSAEGHDSSITIGRVDSIFRAENGEIRGSGVILSGPDAPSESQEYVNLVKAGAAGGVSIDGDSAEFEIIESDTDDPWDFKMEFSSINIRALTAVDIPAFAGAKITLSESVVADGTPASEVIEEINETNEEFTRMLVSDRSFESVVAAGIPVDPPLEWFEAKFDSLQPITITDDGRVFGHLAGKETCHIGFGSCKTSPRGCDYDEYFHLGEIKTASGDPVHVGHMTFGGGHAPLDKSAQAAAAYYDSTSRVSADIRAGEDEFGTWIAGALRPGLTPEDIREVRSAPLSGDWRPIKGKLQLLAAHAVNVPGFPIPRVRALVASGITEALIITEDCDCDLSAEFQEMLYEMDIEAMEEI